MHAVLPEEQGGSCGRSRICVGRKRVSIIMEMEGCGLLIGLGKVSGFYPKWKILKKREHGLNYSLQGSLWLLYKT